VLQISLQTFGTTGNGSLFPPVSAPFIPIEISFANFRSGGYGECLLDRPTIDLLEAHRNSKRLPGENFDENKQCEFVFGNGSRICPYMVTQKFPSHSVQSGLLEQQRPSFPDNPHNLSGIERVQIVENSTCE